METADLTRAYAAMDDFLSAYENTDDPSFQLKRVHTYKVSETAAVISRKMKLSEEDCTLAELIGLLHDIGRFEEIRITHEMNNLSFDHAAYGVKMLMEDVLIRRFIKEERYDEIIRAAILNHSRYAVEDGLCERALLHARLLRDSDKTDIFRLKGEEEKYISKDDIDNARFSENVMQAIRKHRCVKLKDRKTGPDCFATVIAFVFDINFEETRKLIRDRNLIERMVSKFPYQNQQTHKDMDEIIQIVKDLGFME